MYTSIYTNNAPVLLTELANTPEMKRLIDIGMHCGCDCANLPIYHQVRYHYTRYMHSIGVANIVWNFTQDIKQAVAGLFHDISTPAFAHTIDFLNGDHLNQESTEEKTVHFIENSKEIMSLLKKHGIRVEDICDYQKYPIADNHTPMLSADRLEYTLGNGYIIYNEDLGEIQDIYNNLTVTKNENDIDELCFKSLSTTKKFVAISLRNSYLYVTDEERLVMQYLADIIQLAIGTNVLLFDDLFTTESNVISKLKCSNETSKLWDTYTKISAVSISDSKKPDIYCVNIPAKKRYIDPLVLTDTSPKRISSIDNATKNKINEFLNLDFDKWISIT